MCRFLFLVTWGYLLEYWKDCGCLSSCLASYRLSIPFSIVLFAFLAQFSGPGEEKLKHAAATFCSNQPFALEMIDPLTTSNVPPLRSLHSSLLSLAAQVTGWDVFSKSYLGSFCQGPWAVLTLWPSLHRHSPMEIWEKQSSTKWTQHRNQICCVWILVPPPGQSLILSVSSRPLMSKTELTTALTSWRCKVRRAQVWGA